MASETQKGGTAARATREGVVHILVVEDEPQVRKLYEVALKRADLAPQGFATRVHCAGSCEEAVDVSSQLCAAGEPIGCALVDFRLGDGPDGIETIKQLWDLEPEMQCTVVTGARELSERVTRDRLPPAFLDQWDFLAKPVTPFEIVQRARRSLGAWHAQIHNRKLLHELEEKVEERTRDLADRAAELETKNVDLQRALRDLEQAQSQLLQNEKMACVGLLAAGVAHDLNNPIGFVHSNLGTLKRYDEKIRQVLEAYALRVGDDDEIDELKRKLKFDFVLTDLPALIEESLEGTERVTKIVTDLKSFSRPTDNEAKFTDINAGLESTLNIVNNEIKYKAQVVRDFGEIPLVFCTPGQINQVFMNLLVNAAQAIEERGEIRLSTRRDDSDVVITIGDTGSGIPDAIRDRIFDPFFTTKEVGQGSGLGLSISYDIVRKHGGTLSVESRGGEGTTFTIRLPSEGVEGWGEDG